MPDFDESYAVEFTGDAERDIKNILAASAKVRAANPGSSLFKAGQSYQDLAEVRSSNTTTYPDKFYDRTRRYLIARGGKSNAVVTKGENTLMGNAKLANPTTFFDYMTNEQKGGDSVGNYSEKRPGALYAVAADSRFVSRGQFLAEHVSYHVQLKQAKSAGTYEKGAHKEHKGGHRFSRPEGFGEGNDNSMVVKKTQENEFKNLRFDDTKGNLTAVRDCLKRKYNDAIGEEHFRSITTVASLRRVGPTHGLAMPRFTHMLRAEFKEEMAKLLPK